MEDQGKRLLLAVALAFGIMLVWQYIFPPAEPEKKPEQTEQVAETDEPAQPEDKPAPGPGEAPQPDGTVDLVGGPKTGPSTGPSTATGPDAQPGLDPAAQQAADIEKELAACQALDAEQPIVFDFPKIRAEFSHCGGTLASWQLKGDRFYETKNGKRQPMDLARTGDLPDKRSFAVTFKDADKGTVIRWNPHATWQLVPERRTETEVAFTWKYQVPDSGGVLQTAFELTKAYKLYPDDYAVEFSIQAVNKAVKNERQVVIVSFYGYQDPGEDTEGGWTSVDRAWRSTCYMGEEESRRTSASLAKSPKERAPGDLAWAGFTHSYFLLVAAPRNDTNADYGCNSYGFDIDGKAGGMRTDIVFPVATISREEGQWIEHSMVAYIGPKYLDKLESISGVVGFEAEFGTSIDFPWYAFLARPLLWLLQWFYAFLGNWGLAIIFLTFLVKLATLYWTNKSMRSMKAMAKLSPQIKAMQEKYKNDKQRLQQETMNLYKTHNVNPLSGCLPILLQMPIWISLYRMLMYAGELYHAPFIPGWIDDLTAADPYYILPFGLMVVMFVQAKLTPTTSTSSQQKILQYGMPLMFGVFSFFFPAGLTLYIFVNTCFSALHHMWMRRTDKAAEEARAASQKGKAGQSSKRAADKTSGRASGKSSSASGRKTSTRDQGRKKSESSERESTSDEQLDDLDFGDESDESDGGETDNQSQTSTRGQRPTRKKRSSKKSRGKRNRGKRGK